MLLCVSGSELESLVGIFFSLRRLLLLLGRRGRVKREKAWDACFSRSRFGLFTLPCGKIGVSVGSGASVDCRVYDLEREREREKEVGRVNIYILYTYYSINSPAITY